MRADEIHPGDVVAGKYRVRAIVSRNPTLTVEAFHVEFDQRVVIKLLLAGTADDKEVERFRREARTLAKLETEHAARILDVGTQADGSFYLVRQFVEGEDLQTYIQNYGPRPLEEAVLFVLQVAEAVAETHAHDIVLREIAPTSIVVARRSGGAPLLKVTDFGTAKLMRDAAAPTGGSSLTATAVFGLSPFSAPEFVRKAKSVDARADVWSLGAVLYALLAGRAPFGGDVTQLMLAITRAEPDPISALRPDLPPEIEQILGWAMAKDLDRRFKHVKALAHALTPFANQEGRVLIDRIRQIAQSRRSAGRTNTAPPPPMSGPGFPAMIPPAQPSFRQGNVDVRPDVAAEFGDLGGGEDDATIALGGAPPSSGPSSSPSSIPFSIPPPRPSVPPSPWSPGNERVPRIIAPASPRIPVAPASVPTTADPGFWRPAIASQPAPPIRHDTLSPVGPRSRDPRGRSDARLLWGALAAMAVMLPVVLLLLLRDPPPPPLALSESDEAKIEPRPQARIPATTGAPVVLDTAAAAVPPTPIPEPVNPQLDVPKPVPVPPDPIAIPNPRAKDPRAADPKPEPKPRPDPKPKEEPKPKEDPKPKPKEDAPAAAGGGTLLAIASGGSCAFSVDGAGRGGGSTLRVTLPGGKHTVSCKPVAGGKKAISKSVTIKPGETSMLTFTM